MSSRIAAGDGDDRVGVLEPGALAEAREAVAAAELLLLPRPQRLEAVHGRDVRDRVDQLRQVAAEVRVPGVAVDEVAPSTPAAIVRSIETARSAARCGAPPASASHGSCATTRRLPVGGPRLAPAVHGDVDELRELAGEVLDVHARAAVDVGRVLAA